MHWLLHVLGVDNVAGPWYGFWSGFGSDLGEAALIVGAVLGVRKGVQWVRATAERHHAERMAQQQAHHNELKHQAEKHHQQRWDQAQAHHEALREHITQLGKGKR